MASEKFPGEDLNLQARYKIKEATDLQISSLDEDVAYLGAEAKSVLSHIRKIVEKLKATDSGNLYQGGIDCAATPNYPAATKDQYWRVSVAGKIGGAVGVIVEVGDMIYCLVDNAGGTEAQVGTSFQIQQANINRAYPVKVEDAYTTSADANAAGLSSAITLANEIRTDMNLHFADSGTGALTSAIALANGIKAAYNIHVADAGAGTEEHIATLAGDGITTANATDLTSLIALITEILAEYDAHDNDAEQVAPVVHTAQEAGDASLASAVAPINLHECIVKLNDAKAKINTHMADATAHENGDNPAIATADAAYVQEHISAQAAVATAVASNFGTLLALTGALLTAYNTHDDDAELGSAWVYHVGQESGNATLTSVVTPTTLAQAVTRLNDLKAKLNTHVADGAGAHVDGDSATIGSPDAVNGTAITVSAGGVVAGDLVSWAILNDGSGNVTGVTAVAGTDIITFTFSGDPGADTIISYIVVRPAVS